MTTQQIQQMLTVPQWAMWLRYVKKNSVKNIGGLWPDYEFHEFYKFLDIKEAEVVKQDSSKEGCDSSGDKPMVPSNLSEDNGVGEQMGVHSYDHVPGRWDSHAYQLPLPLPGDGFKDVGPSGGTGSGV